MSSDFRDVSTKEFGNRLKEALREKGWSQADLMRAAGLTRSLVSAYSNGKSFPSPMALVKISNVLGVSIEYLLTGQESASLSPKDGELMPEGVESSHDPFRPINEYYAYLDLITDPNLLAKIRPTQEELRKLFDAVHAGKIKDLVALIGYLNDLRTDKGVK